MKFSRKTASMKETLEGSAQTSLHTKVIKIERFLKRNLIV
jgi:hypothetical protein